MMKKKDIQAMLDNHISIGNIITNNIREVAKNMNMDYEVKEMKLNNLASKEELNDFAISMLKRILKG